MLGTVDRLGAVLELFSPERPEWGATELAGQLMLAKSQAHEILASMTAIGLLRKTPGSRYRLGWRTVRLGAVAMGNEGLTSAAVPWMRRLVAIHPELSVHLAVWDVDRAIYVGRYIGADVDERVAAVSTVGSEVPLHCTSLGKVLAAMQSEPNLDTYLKPARLERYTRDTITRSTALRSELRLVRERGFAIDQGELESDMMCIATPITHRAEPVVGTIGVCVPPALWSSNAEEYLRCVVDTSQRIARSIARLPTADLKSGADTA